MDQNRRATKEERVAIKEAVLEALSNHPEWPAIDVGQVLVSIGSAMVKASLVSETEFLEYARKAFALQQPAGVGASN